MQNNKRAMMSSWDYSYEQSELGYYDQGLCRAKEYIESYANEIKKTQVRKYKDMTTVEEYVAKLREEQYNNPFVTNPVSKNDMKPRLNKTSFKNLARGLN